MDSKLTSSACRSEVGTHATIEREYGCGSTNLRPHVTDSCHAYSQGEKDRVWLHIQ